MTFGEGAPSARSFMSARDPSDPPVPRAAPDPSGSSRATGADAPSRSASPEVGAGRAAEEGRREGERGERWVGRAGAGG